MLSKVVQLERIGFLWLRGAALEGKLLQLRGMAMEWKSVRLKGMAMEWKSVRLRGAALEWNGAVEGCGLGEQIGAVEECSLGAEIGSVEVCSDVDDGDEIFNGNENDTEFLVMQATQCVPESDIGLELRLSDISEDQKVDLFMTTGCTCTKWKNKSCSIHFSRQYVKEKRLSCMDLTSVELDLTIMGQLIACTNTRERTALIQENTLQPITTTQPKIENGRIHIFFTKGVRFVQKHSVFFMLLVQND